MYTFFAELFKQCHNYWGVDESVGFLRNNGEEIVCTSTVYHFIHGYKREREYWLRHGKHGYRKKKGSNERNNGIIRRCCPKQLSIQQYSEGYIREIGTKINSKPRKILNYTSALIVFIYYLNNIS